MYNIVCLIHSCMAKANCLRFEVNIAGLKTMINFAETSNQA